MSPKNGWRSARSGLREPNSDVRVVVHVEAIAEDDEPSQLRRAPVLAQQLIEQRPWTMRHVEEGDGVESEGMLQDGIAEKWSSSVEGIGRV